ncbi:hypothetical protein E2C01_078724 [Portunus trituberculatus]|uniref:Uncharacterized protein n=1 Tax=Portunus trituberculatus TaxID=210409 RepID=A0A5B7IPH2_PORTR|nr:hypothetical protein [Portunus trituberculatus]
MDAVIVIKRAYQRLQRNIHQYQWRAAAGEGRVGRVLGSVRAGLRVIEEVVKKDFSVGGDAF